MEKNEILDRLSRIIESLIKNDFALLPKTKHLEKTLLTLLSSANELPEGFREELKNCFMGLTCLRFLKRKTVF